MKKRAALCVSLLLLSATANAQLSKAELVKAASAAAAKAAASGEPHDRCYIGVGVGDDGRVLIVDFAKDIAAGDTIKSVNGIQTKGMSPDDFISVLKSIPLTGTVPLEVEHGGGTTKLSAPCRNAKSFNGPIIEAYSAAGRKDFKQCSALLGTLPEAIRQDWHVQYLGTQCAIQNRTVAPDQEPLLVQGWLSSLISEAKYVKSERAAAAEYVTNSESYFRSKNRLDLWQPLKNTVDAVPELASAMPATPDWSALREAGENAVRARLIDPSSAQFQWPYGFTFGTWKPFLAARVEGYWTCGTVNARNRMGGYVGSTAFVVVLDRSGAVKYSEVGTGKDYDILSAQCSKSTNLLPPAPPEMAAAAPAPAGESIADELAKLAKLKEDGVLTQAEFDAQKAKLLSK